MAGGPDELNLATVWETIAATVPDAPAQHHGERTWTWGEWEDRAARLASVFAAHGIGHDDKVAHYLYNGPEYLETTFATFKQRAVPVNVNYRYTESELRYLLDNCDAAAIVVDGALAHHLVPLVAELPLLRVVLQVGGDPIDGALDYHAAIASADPAPPIARSGEDLWFLYTGGTTGVPKGVMWPHRALLSAAAPTLKGYGMAPPETVDDAVATARRVHGLDGHPDAVPSPIVMLPAAPLMHGTSAISSFGVLTSAGSIVTLTERHFSAAELLGTVQARRVTNLAIVGDAFGKPMVAELEAAEVAGRPYDLSSLRTVISSGTMWSRPVKEAFLSRVDVLCADLLGSSEGVGIAASVATRSRAATTAKFRLGPDAAVFDEAGERVQPGSGERGVLAVGGAIPLGYYKDPEKTAATYRTYEGRRWSVAGDWATVEADGSITLLGRGSVCINTAGEKVFPEEVEEVLKTHPAVHDANVVGVPDDRWGSAVCAVVAFEPGTTATDAELVDHCRSVLAGYKCPKRIVAVDAVRRGPNGKADYRWAASVAAGTGPTP